MRRRSEPRVKTYTGYRRHAPDGGHAPAEVTVHKPGQEPRPLDPRLDLRRHSPAGVEWGYAGSGPAQLALALAVDVSADDDRARQVYQAFKFRVISKLAEEGWTLTEDQVRATLSQIEEERARGLRR